VGLFVVEEAVHEKIWVAYQRRFHLMLAFLKRQI